MLIDRFKKYLEQQFRAISPTKEAMEYREEVLQNLLDRAQEYKIKGMTDENAIYDLCIDSLGNFKDTLVDFENRLDNVKRAVPRIGARVLTGIAIALFVVIGYLSVSFATRAWDKTFRSARLWALSQARFSVLSSLRKRKDTLQSAVCRTSSSRLRSRLFSLFCKYSCTSGTAG